MSRLDEAIEPLPFALADQVSGYARSVVGAAPEIFRDAKVVITPSAVEQLEFIAGLRKLLSIVESNYWVLDNAGALLSAQADSSQVWVGSNDVSRGGEYHSQLRELMDGLRKILDDRDVLNAVRNRTYAEIVKELSSGH